MAFNPPLVEIPTGGFVPYMLFPNEVTLLKRTGIIFEGYATTGEKCKDEGFLYITSRRFVFVRKGKPSPNSSWFSVELPIVLTSQHQFKQPIFGANYMKMVVSPVTGRPQPIQGEVSLTFREGGCQTFLSVFYYVVRQQRTFVEAPTPAINQQIQRIAVSDPNDQSILYISSPAPSQGQLHIYQDGIYAPVQASAPPPPVAAPAQPPSAYGNPYSAPSAPSAPQEVNFATNPYSSQQQSSVPNPYGTAPSAPGAPSYVNPYGSNAPVQPQNGHNYSNSNNTNPMPYGLPPSSNPYANNTQGSGPGPYGYPH